MYQPGKSPLMSFTALVTQTIIPISPVTIIPTVKAIAYIRNGRRPAVHCDKKIGSSMAMGIKGTDNNAFVSLAIPASTSFKSLT